MRFEDPIRSHVVKAEIQMLADPQFPRLRFRDFQQHAIRLSTERFSTAL